MPVPRRDARLRSRILNVITGLTTLRWVVQARNSEPRSLSPAVHMRRNRVQADLEIVVVTKGQQG